LDNSTEESSKTRLLKQSNHNLLQQQHNYHHQHQLNHQHHHQQQQPSQQDGHLVSNDQNNKLIQSNSLSSSLSSSSSTSTSSINNQQQSNNTNNPSSAPLATITELQSDKLMSNNSDDEIHFSKEFQKKLIENKMQQFDAEKMNSNTNTKKNRGKGSICSLNNATTATSDTAKYSSSSTFNNRLLSSLLLNNSAQKSNNNKNKFFTQKNNSINSGKGIRGFFGKLMRSSLVNVNETDRMNSSQIEDCFEAIDSNLILVNNNNNAANNPPSNFKRGGLRSTANARLQSSNFSLNSSSKTSTPTHQIDHISQLQQQLQLQLQLQKDGLDTFTFAEWPSERVYEWLRQNGFEAYFPVNSEGICINKWIKSGLHLLQASQFEFEKELGIKNPLHRKRLTLLLQALYNSSLSLNSPENYNLSLIDQHWVTSMYY
jgi:hypothetical protein